MTIPTETPELNYPRVMLVAVDDVNGKNATTIWKMGETHPLDAGMNVIAMYLNEGIIEIYSVSKTSKDGARDLIPMHRARLVREAMPFDIFSEELRNAEAGYPDDDDGDDDLDDPNNAPEPVESSLAPPNGQAVT